MAYDVSTAEVKRRALGKIDGALIGKALAKLHDAPVFDERFGKNIVKMGKLTEKALREEALNLAKKGNMDPFGDYDKAIELFQKRVKEQKFCQTIVNNVPKYINLIFEHVTY